MDVQTNRSAQPAPADADADACERYSLQKLLERLLDSRRPPFAPAEAEQFRRLLGNVRDAKHVQIIMDKFKIGKLTTTESAEFLLADHQRLKEGG